MMMKISRLINFPQTIPVFVIMMMMMMMVDDDYDDPDKNGLQKKKLSKSFRSMGVSSLTRKKIKIITNKPSIMPPPKKNHFHSLISYDDNHHHHHQYFYFT